MICKDIQSILEHHFSPFGRKAVVGGMSAGAIGQFFASPTDLVKVQMQMEGKRKLEGKPLRLVHLRAGGFFPVTDHSLAQAVVPCVSCHPFSPAALCPFTGRAPNGSGQPAGDSRPAPYSIYSDLLVPGITNPSSVLQHVHGSTVPWGGKDAFSRWKKAQGKWLMQGRLAHSRA